MWPWIQAYQLAWAFHVALVSGRSGFLAQSKDVCVGKWLFVSC